MPLSKARMRERKRLDRLNVKPMSNLSPIRPVKPKLEELRHLIKSIESKPTESLPIYNPSIHRPGDTVLVQRGKRLIQTTIPLLDADGQPLPEYT